MSFLFDIRFIRIKLSFKNTFLLAEIFWISIFKIETDELILCQLQ